MDLDALIRSWGYGNEDLLEGQKNFIEGARFVLDNVLEARLEELRALKGDDSSVINQIRNELAMRTIGDIKEEVIEQLFMYVVFCAEQNGRSKNPGGVC